MFFTTVINIFTCKKKHKSEYFMCTITYKIVKPFKNNSQYIVR